MAYIEEREARAIGRRSERETRRWQRGRAERSTRASDFSREGGDAHLAAEGRRRLLAPPLPGAIRPVDVVEARHPGLHAKVLLVVLAQLLRVQLLQAVGILGRSGPGVGLHQAGGAAEVGLELLAL